MLTNIASSLLSALPSVCGNPLTGWVVGFFVVVVLKHLLLRACPHLAEDSHVPQMGEKICIKTALELRN